MDDQATKEFTEVLQELRVVQTGVQILSAFLLTLPFTQRFAAANRLELAAYTVALLAAMVATGLVIAPVSYHRRHRDDEERLRRLTRIAATCAKAGMVSLLISAVAAVFLALDVALGLPLALAGGGFALVVLAGLWFAVPVGKGHRRGDYRDSGQGG